MRRLGITLLEVLMAIFIMGIGMLSVLALFPVAALMMGQAIERYQVNEVINNSQSNFDPDALEFVKNNPDWLLFSNTAIKVNSANYFLSGNLAGITNSIPQYLFVDQAAGVSKVVKLGGVDVSYINNNANFSIMTQYNSATPNYPTTPKQYSFSNFINEKYFILNNDIELDESGRVAEINLFTNPPQYSPSALGRYSISFLLEKRQPFDSLVASRRFMFIYKGRSELIPDYPSVNSKPVPLGLPLISNAGFNLNLFSVVNANTITCDDKNPLSVPSLDFSAFLANCKKNDWLMLLNSAGERSFHRITNIINDKELEVSPKFNSTLINGTTFLISVYLLQDVIRVVDLGAG